jgi:hypothetical protein
MRLRTRSTVSRVGFKAIGWHSHRSRSHDLLRWWQRILGPQALSPKRLRIGASSILSDIEAVSGAGRALRSASGAPPTGAAGTYEVTALLAQEIIRVKRDGGVLDACADRRICAGLVDSSWSDGQVLRWPWRCFCKGMTRPRPLA